LVSAIICGAFATCSWGVAGAGVPGVVVAGAGVLAPGVIVASLPSVLSLEAGLLVCWELGAQAAKNSTGINPANRVTVKVLKQKIGLFMVLLEIK